MAREDQGNIIELAGAILGGQFDGGVKLKGRFEDRQARLFKETVNALVTNHPYAIAEVFMVDRTERQEPYVRHAAAFRRPRDGKLVSYGNRTDLYRQGVRHKRPVTEVLRRAAQGDLPNEVQPFRDNCRAFLERGDNHRRKREYVDINTYRSGQLEGVFVSATARATAGVESHRIHNDLRKDFCSWDPAQETNLPPNPLFLLAYECQHADEIGQQGGRALLRSMLIAPMIAPCTLSLLEQDKEELVTVTSGSQIGFLRLMNRTESPVSRDHADFTLQDLSLARVVASLLLQKWLELPRLSASVAARSYIKLAQALPALSKSRDVHSADPRGQLIGRSAPFRELLELADSLGQRDPYSVYILAPEGGELFEIAQRIHNASKREGEEPRICQCGARSGEEQVAHLFGRANLESLSSNEYEKGVIEAYEKGTILIEDVHKASKGFQDRLFRFLSKNEVQPSGGDPHPVKSHARVLIAASLAIEAEVSAGRFSGDLKKQMENLMLRIPTVAERGGEDLLLMARFFLQRYLSDLGEVRLQSMRVDHDFVPTLKRLDWSGNRDQLKAVLQRVVLACGKAKVIRGRDVEKEYAAFCGPTSSPEEQDQAAWYSFKYRLGKEELKDLKSRLSREVKENALFLAEGNARKAAELAGVTTSMMYQYRQQFQSLASDENGGQND